MKYFSEKLNKLFDEVEALNAAEAECARMEEERLRKLENEKKEAAALEEEFDTVCEMFSDYLEHATQFHSSYGYLPKTIIAEHHSEGKTKTLFDIIFNVI